MFQGRKYVQQGGYKGWAVRFSDNLSAPGVATTSYSFAMSDKERYEMARRITAALNLTRSRPCVWRRQLATPEKFNPQIDAAIKTQSRKLR